MREGPTDMPEAPMSSAEDRASTRAHSGRSDLRGADLEAEPSGAVGVGMTPSLRSGASAQGFMSLRNLSIATQLRLGMGVILALVALLGATAWMQNESLWQSTKAFHDHPFTVTKALGDLRADIMAMREGIKDAARSDSDAERLRASQAIDDHEVSAQRQLTVISERYLGPRADLHDVWHLFARWKAVRNESLADVSSGRKAEALRRVRLDGVGGSHFTSVIKALDRLDQFATVRTDEFFREAEGHKTSLLLQLGTLFGVIALLSLGVGYLLLRGIRAPMDELTSVTEQFRRGWLDVRSGYVSTNEMGLLAAAFNRMADTLQHDMQHREDSARISDMMLREEEMRPFCRALLGELLERTGSQLGAAYLLNAARTDFELVESVGMVTARRASFSATGGEGEFSAALATRKIQHITDIPADTAFTFATAVGDFMPREILTIPITTGHDVTAVISLASLRSYSAQALDLVNGCLDIVTARLSGVIATQEVRAFSARLEEHNRELEEQRRELASQAGELTERNIELDMQKQELTQASMMKSRFLSNMSHELRTPLNSVIALSGVLGRRLRGAVSEEEYSYIEVIERNGRQLLTLINDILDLSRIEAGHEELSVSVFSVQVLAAEVTTMIEVQAREKGIVLLNSIDAGLPQIASDFSKCRHILQNLVGNAVKFTERGQVEISASHHDGECRIAVADTGIGIAAEQIPFIFDEFRQADERTSKKYGGTGLGLSIAGRYAAMLGGDIRVKSVPGVGSTFTVRLPLAIKDTDGKAGTHARPPATSFSGVRVADTAGAAASKPGHGYSILLVEDSEPAIVQVTGILREQGYSVRVARNGREALAQIGDALPSAIILDLMMPDMDGFEMLRAMRAEPSAARIPVLILTARHVSKDELSFLTDNNIHELVQKGDVSRTALLAAIATMVAPRAQRRANPPTPARAPRVGKPVILAVEDNPDNMQTVRALLRDVATLIEAADGPSGVEQATQQQPDLILLDISLPGMDGFRVLDEIRKHERLRHIPIIALTARAMLSEREEILAYGFDGYVSKPIDDAVLRQSIGEVLHGRSC